LTKLEVSYYVIARWQKCYKWNDNNQKISQSVLFAIHNTMQTAKCTKRKPLYGVTGITHSQGF